ncbi:MAG: hypothetical protein E2O36_08485, partial [Proteobacteria bacterium]
MAKKRASRPNKHSYAMPELSGLYGKPPFDYRDSKTLAIQFQIDPDILRRLVPAPLRPNSDGTMFVFVAEFFCSACGHYYEAHIFTVAKLKRRPVNYSIYLVLDNDVALSDGREIWGLPKKFGRLTITVKDDVMSATVERGGSTIIEAAMRMAEFGAPEELAGTPEWVAHKLIPSVSLTAPPEVDQLTSTTLTNTTYARYTKARRRYASAPHRRIGSKRSPSIMSLAATSMSVISPSAMGRSCTTTSPRRL